EGRIYKDIYEAEAVANDFEIEDTEWGKKLKEHMEIFIEATNGEIPVCIADYQSPYGSATKLLPNEELMMAMYDEPELVHKLLNTVTDGIIKLIDTMEKWAGEELFAYNMYNPLPGLDGLCIWDDYISVITPSLHQEFCRPYNLKLFERYGHGHLHTCGPYFPNFIDSVLACKPRTLDMIILRGMGKSREDMLKLLEIAKKNDILLTCPLDYNDVSFFDPNPQRVDDTFLYKFMEGGYMPSATGTYEYGLEFAKKVRAFK
ncbi:MAG: hypothetical protein FWC89_13070, partial [Defluviitaleaceae bacterium]|nr:hypothetical protein [Defluviitaleaceae bacterium]